MMKDYDVVGKNNIMVDMAVSADKGPFLGVEKANDNLQRALDRFLTYHEKEKKAANRQFEQEARLYKRKMERCKTANRKTRSNCQTIEEEPQCPTHGKQWPKSYSREKPLSRPKTAGELRKKVPKTPRDPDLMQMTYTFDSIFGDVQKTVASSNLSPASAGSNGSDEPDPLGVYRDRDIVITHKQRENEQRTEREESYDVVSNTLSPMPPWSHPTNSSASTPRRGSRPGLSRLASMDAYQEIERKRTMSITSDDGMSPVYLNVKQLLG